MEDDHENRSQPIEQDHKKQPVPGSLAKPGSGEGKLCIKLKIPKVDEDQIGPQRNDQPRVCKVCNKGFSSGKALGGHVRVHVQANKELFLKKPKIDSQPKKQNKKLHRQQLVDTSENRDTNNATNELSTGSDKPICSLCGKNFPSMKSLFGHMRCHPEREWRGIQPPPALKNSSSSSVSNAEPRKVDDRIDSDFAPMETQETDLIKSLPGWSATARRGRKAVSAVPVTEEERLRDAVHFLMRLSHGDSLESGLTHKNRIEAYEATNSNSLTNKAEIEDKNWVLESKKRRIEDYPAKKLRIDERGSTDPGTSGLLEKNLDKAGKGKAVMETENIPEKSLGIGYEWVYGDWPGEDDESDSKNSDGSVPSEQLIMNYKFESTTTPLMIKSKKRKKMKLRDLESVRDGTPGDQIYPPVEITTTPPPDRYKCSTCNKCFPTHQALGGHRSSHNKVMRNNLTIDEPSSPAPADQEENQANPIIPADETNENEGAGSSKQAESTHQCKICSKNFPTGQALGGHKRCHWTAPAEGPSSQATSPGEASQTGRGILGFDLNELPAMEDDEDGTESEQAGGYGYASSLDNSAA